MMSFSFSNFSPCPLNQYSNNGNTASWMMLPWPTGVCLMWKTLSHLSAVEKEISNLELRNVISDKAITAPRPHLNVTVASAAVCHAVPLNSIHVTFSTVSLLFSLLPLWSLLNICLFYLFVALAFLSHIIHSHVVKVPPEITRWPHARGEMHLVMGELKS